MNNTGLVSVSFRGLSVPEIVALCAKNGLEYIEWGGDIHCPQGDIKTAESARRLTQDSGLCVSSYGSYYRLGVSRDDGETFSGVLASSKALGSSIIRVWAGEKGSEEMTESERNECIRDCKIICGMAAKEDAKITFECHNNTLTDDYRSTLSVLSDVACDNLLMHWQPNQFRSLEYNLDSIKALYDVITIVHVFNWLGKEKYPLSDGITVWDKYVSLLEGSKYSHKYLLEFMPKGTAEEMPAEVKALKTILWGAK